VDTVFAASLTQWAVLLLYVTHALCIAVWVGVMLFNLIVKFPAMRARSADSEELLRNVATQAHRAGPWLYLLIAGTLASGLGLLLMAPPPAPLAQQVLAAKAVLIALMFAVHLYATLRILPQLHFALERERPALLLSYQVTIAASSAFGILAIVLGYAPRAFL
jgi:putative copper export protein